MIFRRHPKQGQNLWITFSNFWTETVMCKLARINFWVRIRSGRGLWFDWRTAGCF